MYGKLNIILKLTFNPIVFVLPVNHSKARLVVFASRNAISFVFFKIILQPLTRTTRLRRSCFMERRAPLEALTGGNMSSCCCRQSSIPNNVGGTRTPTVFQVDQ